MASDFPRLVLDANVMVSAVLGASFPFLLRLFEAEVELMAPVQQFAETRHILVAKRQLPETWVDDQMRRLHAIVMPIHPVILQKHEAKAKARLGPRGEPDWPVLAATYATAAAAWSHDKDLFGSGAPVWSTRILMRELDYPRPGGEPRSIETNG